MTGWIELDVQEETAHEEGNGCPACGFLNPASETVCLACASAVEPRRGQSRCSAIDQQVGRVRRGALTAEDFRRWLEDLSGQMARKASAILGYIDAQRYRDDSPDEVCYGLAGIERFESGLSELWQYTQDLDASHLDLGLSLVWEGNDLILEAMRLNRETREETSLAYEHIQEQLCA